MATPPFDASASMSRSRTSLDELRSTADALLSSSLAHDNSTPFHEAPLRMPESMSDVSGLPPPYQDVEHLQPPPLSSEPPQIGDIPNMTMINDGLPLIGMQVLGQGGSSTASTTSHTRNRLRELEEERDQLRRIVEEERAVNARLKFEGSKEELSPLEVQRRMLQLKSEAQIAQEQSSRGSMSGLFKEACSTDLLFLMDTTSSMAGHINAAKEQVKSIVDNIEATFFNEAEVRMAVVGYKDHTDNPNIQFLDFTSSADEVRAFVSDFTAHGGADIPEDVLGGMKQAINASWQQQNRCIIHIADAPPHGRNVQSPVISGDRYPEPGSEPHELTYEPLLNQMINMNINYAFLRINDYTDFMAYTWFKAYAEAGGNCQLNLSNKFYHKAFDLTTTARRKTSSKRSALGGLMFEESQLGTTYSTLRHLIVRAVTNSASRTAVRLSSSSSMATKTMANKKADLNLAAIEESDNDEDGLELENVPPEWDSIGWLNEELSVEGFSPDIVVHGASTLNDMMDNDDNIKLSVTELTVHKRSKPFAQGAMRVAAYARTGASTSNFVVKSFKKGGKQLAHLAEDMRCQALCKAFALEFNSLTGEEHELDFIVTTCFKGKARRGLTVDCMSLEPFLEGAYVKYNSNCGYVNRDIPNDQSNQAAQAFSHFTFERSQGHLLVADLQGVGNLLTDPAIHTLDSERFKLADANLGKEGFKFFFATHECNEICKKLELVSKASMVASGTYSFRQDWPSMDATTCCSNKICGKIVRLSKAKTSVKWPGHQWCKTCWPQLHRTMMQRICIAPGPVHEFRASKFFYESQGRIGPRRCAEHREDGLTDLTALVDTVLESTEFNEDETDGTDKSSMSESVEDSECLEPEPDAIEGSTAAGSSWADARRVEAATKSRSEARVKTSNLYSVWKRLKSAITKKPN